MQLLLIDPVVGCGNVIGRLVALVTLIGWEYLTVGAVDTLRPVPMSEWWGSTLPSIMVV
jgi:hypothetical protein